MSASGSLPHKISALVFVRDERGRLLLLERAKQPNAGLLSPIGGKLEISSGESPFECAVRETREEIGLEISESDLHLFSIVAEKSYEGGAHWLMFLFDCRKRVRALPPDIAEGKFRLASEGEIFGGALAIPETDRLLLWDIWRKYRGGGIAILRADCAREIKYKIEEAF